MSFQLSSDPIYGLQGETANVDITPVGPCVDLSGLSAFYCSEPFFFGENSEIKLSVVGPCVDLSEFEINCSWIDVETGESYQTNVSANIRFTFNYLSGEKYQSGIIDPYEFKDGSAFSADFLKITKFEFSQADGQFAALDIIKIAEFDLGCFDGSGVSTSVEEIVEFSFECFDGITASTEFVEIVEFSFECFEGESESTEFVEIVEFTFAYFDGSGVSTSVDEIVEFTFACFDGSGVSTSVDEIVEFSFECFDGQNTKIAIDKWVEIYSVYTDGQNISTHIGDVYIDLAAEFLEGESAVSSIHKYVWIECGISTGENLNSDPYMILDDSSREYEIPDYRLIEIPCGQYTAPDWSALLNYTYECTSGSAGIRLTDGQTVDFSFIKIPEISINQSEGWNYQSNVINQSIVRVDFSDGQTNQTEIIKISEYTIQIDVGEQATAEFSSSGVAIHSEFVSGESLSADIECNHLFRILQSDGYSVASSFNEFVEFEIRQSDGHSAFAEFAEFTEFSITQADGYSSNVDIVNVVEFDISQSDGSISNSTVEEIVEFNINQSDGCISSAEIDGIAEFDLNQADGCAVSAEISKIVEFVIFQIDGSIANSIVEEIVEFDIDLSDGSSAYSTIEKIVEFEIHQTDGYDVSADVIEFVEFEIQQVEGYYSTAILSEIVELEIQITDGQSVNASLGDLVKFEIHQTDGFNLYANVLKIPEFESRYSDGIESDFSLFNFSILDYDLSCVEYTPSSEYRPYSCTAIVDRHWNWSGERFSVSNLYTQTAFGFSIIASETHSVDISSQFTFKLDIQSSEELVHHLYLPHRESVEHNSTDGTNYQTKLTISENIAGVLIWDGASSSLDLHTENLAVSPVFEDGLYSSTNTITFSSTNTLFETCVDYPESIQITCSSDDIIQFKNQVCTPSEFNNRSGETIDVQISWSEWDSLSIRHQSGETLSSSLLTELFVDVSSHSSDGQTLISDLNLGSAPILISTRYQSGEAVSSELTLEIKFNFFDGSSAEYELELAPPGQFVESVFRDGTAASAFNLLTQPRIPLIFDGSLKSEFDSACFFDFESFDNLNEIRRFITPSRVNNEFIDPETGDAMEFALEFMPFIGKIHFCHHYYHQYTYHIIDGQMPDGLKMDSAGCIRGVVQNLDTMSFNDSVSPSHNWFGEDYFGDHVSIERIFRFRVLAKDKDSGADIFDGWFIIEAMNNWGYDMDEMLQKIAKAEVLFMQTGDTAPLVNIIDSIEQPKPLCECDFNAASTKEIIIPENEPPTFNDIRQMSEEVENERRRVNQTMPIDIRFMAGEGTETEF